MSLLRNVHSSYYRLSKNYFEFHSSFRRSRRSLSLCRVYSKIELWEFDSAWLHTKWSLVRVSCYLAHCSAKAHRISAPLFNIFSTVFMNCSSDYQYKCHTLTIQFQVEVSFDVEFGYPPQNIVLLLTQAMRAQLYTALSIMLKIRVTDLPTSKCRAKTSQSYWQTLVNLHLIYFSSQCQCGLTENAQQMWRFGRYQNVYHLK